MIVSQRRTDDTGGEVVFEFSPNSRVVYDAVDVVVHGVRVEERPIKLYHVDFFEDSGTPRSVRDIHIVGVHYDLLPEIRAAPFAHCLSNLTPVISWHVILLIVGVHCDLR